MIKLKSLFVKAKLFLFSFDLEYAARVFHSDKFHVHNYIPFYVRFFSSLRKQRISLLEIGIGGYDNPKLGGASLKMWENYFKNGEVYGIDIFDKSFFNTNRIRTFVGSQSDPIFLEEVYRDIKSLDIIIDDGSHVSSDVIASFNLLFPKLNSGGFYVVEDLQTSYWKEYGGGYGNPQTSIEYFKNLFDWVNISEITESPIDFPFFVPDIDFVFFSHNILFIKKK